MSNQAVVNVLTRGSPSPRHCPLQGNSSLLSRTDGSRTIWESSDIFTGGIDPLFRKVNVKGGETDEATLSVCHEAHGVTCRCFPDFMATAFGTTQHQVVRFAQQYPDNIRAFGLPIWFPFRLHGLLYVASIDVDGDNRLTARKIELSFGVDICSVMDGHHGVVILRPISRMFA